MHACIRLSAGQRNLVCVHTSKVVCVPDVIMEGDLPQHNKQIALLIRLRGRIWFEIYWCVVPYECSYVSGRAANRRARNA